MTQKRTVRPTVAEVKAIIRAASTYSTPTVTQADHPAGAVHVSGYMTTSALKGLLAAFPKTVIVMHGKDNALCISILEAEA